MTGFDSNPPAGWYRDPAGGEGERFWDGIAWSQATRETQPAGQAEQQHMVGASAQPHAPGVRRVEYQTSPYAGFGWRMLGFVIDMFLITILGNIVTSLTPLDAMADRGLMRWARAITLWAESPTDAMPLGDSELWFAVIASSLLSMVVYGLYRTLMLRYLSATVGQLAVGLRVARDGEEPTVGLSWKSAVLRGFIGALAWHVIFVINHVFAIFTAKRQTLSDMLSKTVVYKVR